MRGRRPGWIRDPPADPEPARQFGQQRVADRQRAGQRQPELVAVEARAGISRSGSGGRPPPGRTSRTGTRRSSAAACDRACGTRPDRRREVHPDDEPEGRVEDHRDSDVEPAPAVELRSQAATPSRSTRSGMSPSSQPALDVTPRRSGRLRRVGSPGRAAARRGERPMRSAGHAADSLAEAAHRPDRGDQSRARRAPAASAATRDGPGRSVVLAAAAAGRRPTWAAGGIDRLASPDTRR